MIKCISNRELEELGDGLVRSFLIKSGGYQPTKCVDIEGLAKSLGLNIVVETFAEDDYDKIGFLADGKTPLKIKRKNQIVSHVFPLRTIVVERSLRRENESGKYRFTIAHEVAHYILDKHNPIPQFQRSFDAERSYAVEELKLQFNLCETQADKLAAALLMPFFIVETALRDFNHGNKIRIYGDNVLEPEERIKLNKMAAQIGVSFTALSIRLRHLGMFEYRPLREYIESQLLGVAEGWRE